MLIERLKKLVTLNNVEEITPEAMDKAKIELLKKLGILDNFEEITPEAYVGFVTRLPVNKQAEALGIPLFLLPPPTKRDKPESKVLRFFSKDKNLILSGFFEESFLVKRFIGCIANGFDVRRRKHEFTDSYIEMICKDITKLTEDDVVLMIEKYHGSRVFTRHFSMVYAIRFPSEANNEKEYTLESLESRFKKVEYYECGAHGTPDEDKEALEEAKSYIKSKRQAKIYASKMMENIILWRSLSPYDWANLVKTALENWEKMATGWPDLNIVSPEVGLVFVEVKGKDKLHPSQVFTIIKLRQVLGSSRVAVAWSNRIACKLPVKKQDHQKMVRDWLYMGLEERKKIDFHPPYFYDKSQSLFKLKYNNSKS